MLAIANAFEVDIRELFAFTKCRHLIDLHMKDQNGNKIQIGELDMSKVKVSA